MQDEKERIDDRAEQLVQSLRNNLRIRWQCSDQCSLFYENLQSRPGLLISHIFDDTFMMCDKCESLNCLNHWLEIKRKT